MNKLSILIVIFCIQFGFAQTIETDNPIKGKVLNTYTGTLLVKTSKELMGIGSESHKIDWRSKELEKNDFETYQEIPFTPLVIFEKKPLIGANILSKSLGTKGVSRTIINVTNGKVLFNSEKQGFKAVNNTLLIPEKNAVLVDGIKKKEPVIALYNYENGELIWELNVDKSKFFKRVKGAVLDNEKILLDDSNNIFWLKNKQLLKINVHTGNIDFEQSDLLSFNMNKDKSVVYLFSDKIELKQLNQQTAILAYDIKSMKPLWKEPTQVLGNIIESTIENKRLIVITSTGFNIIDKNGKKQWEKSEPLPLIKKIIPVQDGYLVAQEEFLTRVDKTGKKAWEKPVKISLSAEERPIHLFTENDSTMYITPSKANIVKVSDGKNLSEGIQFNTSGFVTRNLKLKSHPFGVWYDKKRKQFLVFNENDFYLLDITSVKNSEPLYEFDFKNEVPHLDIRTDGYLFSNNNHFYYFDTNGKLVYKKEYASTEQKSLLNKAVGIVKRGTGSYFAALGFVKSQLNKTFRNVLISKDLGFISNSASFIYGNYQSYQGSFDDLTAINAIDINSSLEQIFQRVKKGQENNQSILVTVPNEDETIKIQRLYIDSGKEEIVKTINQDQSDFLVDDVENVIYIFEKESVSVDEL